MTETELLEIDIKDISNGIDRLEEALNDLNEIEEFTYEDYNYLQDLLERMNDARRDKEYKLEILED